MRAYLPPREPGCESPLPKGDTNRIAGSRELFVHELRLLGVYGRVQTRF